MMLLYTTRPTSIFKIYLYKNKTYQLTCLCMVHYLCISYDCSKAGYLLYPCNLQELRLTSLL